MNRETRTRNWILFPMVLGLALFEVLVSAQSPTPQNPIEPAQTQTQTTQANQASQLPDFAQLNLLPEQIQKIRAINAELKDQRQAANLRLRQAQRGTSNNGDREEKR